jgi:hypothetical protein
MTMTADRHAGPIAARETTEQINWTVVQSGVWVGKCHGEFAGMIEADWGNGFIATTRLAKTLGTFDTVEAAQASFIEP